MLFRSPNLHIAYFLEICDMFRVDDVPDDAIRLRLFPFSLKDRAREWLNSFPAGSISDWVTLAQKFLAKYFPQVRLSNCVMISLTLCNMTRNLCMKLGRDTRIY